MACTIKLNYDHKALTNVEDYDRKCDATIRSFNLMSPFIIVISL